MAKNKLSNSIRFEVFKRDFFQCQYCGRTPPGVMLELDHINPKSRGGSDDINNLITSCFECNRGKSNVPLQRITNTISQNLEILKEREKQLAEYNRFLEKINASTNIDIQEICNIYEKHFPKWTPSDAFRSRTIKTFLKKLPKQEVVEAMEMACYKFAGQSEKNSNVLPYFCGICWRKIKGDPNA